MQVVAEEVFIEIPDKAGLITEPLNLMSSFIHQPERNVFIAVLLEALLGKEPSLVAHAHDLPHRRPPRRGAVRRIGDPSWSRRGGRRHCTDGHARQSAALRSATSRLLPNSPRPFQRVCLSLKGVNAFYISMQS